MFCHYLIIVCILIMGTFFNAYYLSLCCRKDNWKKLSNIKFLIVIQVLSSLIVIACSLAIEFIDVLPQSYCILLPATLMFALSFAWSNLAVLLVVKHAQLTSTWSLRFKTAWMMICTELVVCTVVEFPVIYSASAIGSPILFFDGDVCTSCCPQTTKEQVPWGMKINVVSYLFWYLFIYFGIVGTLIVNRFFAIMMHLCYKEADDKQKPRQTCYNTAHYLMTSLCIIVVNVFFMLLSVHLQNDEETLNYLNKILHEMITFSLSFLCFPFYFCYGEISSEIARARSSHDEKTELLSIKDDLIIA